MQGSMEDHYSERVRKATQPYRVEAYDEKILGAKHVIPTSPGDSFRPDPPLSAGTSPSPTQQAESIVKTSKSVRIEQPLAVPGLVSEDHKIAVSTGQSTAATAPQFDQQVMRLPTTKRIPERQCRVQPPGEELSEPQRQREYFRKDPFGEAARNRCVWLDNWCED